MPWGLSILLGAGLVCGWALLVVYTAWLLTHPVRRSYAFAVARNLPGDPSEVIVVDAAGGSRRGLAYTEWTFRSRGRELPVWDIAGLDPAGPVVVVTHGWGDSRVVMLPRIVGLAPMVSRIVAWDLPGHGNAPGRGGGGFTLSAREHEDLIELVERLAEQSGGDGPRLILDGFSLGAGLCIVAAADFGARGGTNPVAAVIAEAPYRVPAVPARNVLHVRGLPHRTNLLPAMALVGLRFGRGLAWAMSPSAGGFDRALYAARVPGSVPLLVVHGAVDPVCPVEDGKAIAGAASSARLAVIEGAGHNNLWADPVFAPQCAAVVREFLSSIGRTSPGPTKRVPAASEVV